MYTSVVKAVRTHYAALQHRPGEGRIGLRYHVYGGKLGLRSDCLTYGTIWVKASNEGRKKMEMTKLQNRLFSMYPEAVGVDIEVWEKN